MEIAWPEGESARAKLIISVRMADRETRMQLDTGSEHSWLYGDELVKELSLERIAVDGISSVQLDLRIGTRVFSQHRMALHPPVEEDDGLIGTLGMDFLLGKVVSIDYVRRDVCFLPGDVDPESRWPAVRFISAELETGRLVLPWSVDGAETLRIFFDTGTGSVPFVVDKSTWQRLTSRTGLEHDNPRHTVPAFHGTHELVGSLLAKRLSLGGFVAGEEAIVFYIEDLSQNPSQWPDHVHGLSGNSLFEDQRVIIDARDSAPRFAVVSSE